MNLIINTIIYNVIAIVFLLITMYKNPRLVMQDYPEEILLDIPPQTEEEKRVGGFWGLPFIINMFLYPLIFTLILGLKGSGGFLSYWFISFTMLFSFNLIDLLLVDWILFCRITPPFLILPGTAGHIGYKNYLFHFKAFLKGSIIVFFSSLLLSGIAELIVRWIK